VSLFSWLTKDREQTFVVIDIGSSSVGAGLALVRGDKKPELVASSRHDLRLREHLTFKDLLLETERALKESLHDLAGKSAGRPKPKKYVCFLSSPYYLAKTVTIKHSEKGKFIFTKKLLDRLSTDEAEEFAAEQALLYPEILGDRNIVIEKNITRVKLNGYESARPFNQEAQVAEISQYMSIGSLAVLERLEEVIIGATHRGEIEFHTYPFALGEAFHQSLKTNKNFAVIDVSGELTDIVFSDQGVISQNVTIPFGRHTLLRRLAKTTGYLFEELPGLLALYRHDKLSPEAKSRLEPAIKSATAIWATALEQAFVVAAKNVSLPSLVYLLGEDEADRLFSRALAGADISGHFRANLTVRSAGRELFGDHGREDIFLVLESLFCGKIL
jgi:hypothetical protein